MRKVLRIRLWVGLVLTGSLLLTSACVTSGTHERVVSERDTLASEAKRLSDASARLETANESLSSERVTLIDEMETLRGERDQLRAESSGLKSLTTELSVTLEERELEVAENRAEVERLQSTYHGLVQDLESEVAAGQIEIEQLREGVRVNVSDEILFASGSAQLDRIGREVLDKVAKRLVEGEYRVEVQGHTDNLAIRGTLAERYPTNWELAGARASRVVRLFQKAGVVGTRMNAVSFGEYHPVSLNDTPENRWRNRRIEIRLHPLTDLIPVGDGKAPKEAAVGSEAGASEQSPDSEGTADSTAASEPASQP